MKKLFAILILAFLTFNARGAEAVKIDAGAGLPNFYKVSDNLYRGAQPDAGGFAKLPSYRIKTVINLRAENTDEKLLKGLPLNYKRIPINTWNFKEKYVEQFLTIMADPQNLPVFVHCQHGSDRTGTMVAVYRIVVEGESKEAALDEMTKGPFGFHKIWQNLPRLINNLDVEKLKSFYAAQQAAALARETAAPAAQPLHPAPAM